MSADVTIEPATSDDVEAVAELWVRLARGQRAYDSYVRADANRNRMRETLAAHQATDGLLVARAGADDTLVGFVSFSLEHGTLELDATRGTISNIYVEPTHRGRGIGAALLEAAEDALADRGAEVVILEVMADNEAARRFYREQGFDAFRVTMERSLADRDEQAVQSENDTHSKEDE
ncbi:GNAT family N-acetyltransferase [Halopiger xanaduensis]|uniref:GCN5-related N-acetyltransferase n=1 Tax=Halopiger xanaduensis (strain DSM 18323 / JCM 14033 / SH-6) TaxID=797210 RepID=F8D6M1_HALXS|nr:GNAT family N-acetyltransferase [Halopiger xanaduensis]AEH37761.1 GCN5-related N-acetyltransferase [Halopiger xanaduensis SH-6]